MAAPPVSRSELGDRDGGSQGGRAAADSVLALPALGGAAEAARFTEAPDAGGRRLTGRALAGGALAGCPTLRPPLPAASQDRALSKWCCTARTAHALACRQRAPSAPQERTTAASAGRVRSLRHGRHSRPGVRQSRSAPPSLWVTSGPRSLASQRCLRPPQRNKPDIPNADLQVRSRGGARIRDRKSTR